MTSPIAQSWHPQSFAHISPWGQVAPTIQPPFPPQPFPTHWPTGVGPTGTAHFLFPLTQNSRPLQWGKVPTTQLQAIQPYEVSLTSIPIQVRPQRIAVFGIFP